MSFFVISLDFELFWGVVDSRTIPNYRRNIEGVWTAIPKMLELFTRYGISATWATVGMLMCRDYEQWREIRPSVLPGYLRAQCSTFSLDHVVRENPKLFFARSLVEKISDTSGQEIASHSYSHFFCCEVGASTEQFAADLECASEIGGELGIKYRSFVFPRNQVTEGCLIELAKAGYKTFRGNPNHWLYRDGHSVAGGKLGRGVRLADAYIPFSGSHVEKIVTVCGLNNVQASLSLRPWSSRFGVFEEIRLKRLKKSMTDAPLTDSIFHLWWHPHNFGVNIEENLQILESLLQHFVTLRGEYGMTSVQMADFSNGEQ